MTYGMGPYPQQVASSGGRNTFSDIYDNFNSVASGVRPRIGDAARTAGGAARGAVSNAMTGARGAYGAVKSFIPAAGGVLAVVGGGLEAKARLDRGEDGQRAATGGIVNTLGSIGGGALGFIASGGNPLGAMAGAAAGSSAASFVNDRVTDLVRGNDGKGTDDVVRDLDGQITAAQGRGDIAKATQLIAQQGQFLAGRNRQNESPYMQGNRANAGDYGVGPDGMPDFNAAVNGAGVGQFQQDAQFRGDLRRQQQDFSQKLAQKGTFDTYEDPRLEKIRQQVSNMNRAAQIGFDQSKMIAGQGDRMNNASAAALNSIIQSGTFAPR